MDRRQFLAVSTTGSLGLVAGGSTTLMTGCSTDWVQIVLNDIPVIVNIISSLTAVIGQATGNGLLSAAVASVVSSAVSVSSASLTALKDAVDAYEANKSAGNLQAVISALQTAQVDVQKVIASLPAGSVSTQVQTIIVAGIGVAVTVLSSIQSIIPGAAPNTVTARMTATAITTKVELPNAAALKSGFNSVLWLHGFPSLQVK